MNPFKLAMIFLTLALTGCGKADATKPDDFKGPGVTPSSATLTPGGTSTPVGGGPTAPSTPGPTRLGPTDPSQQLAERFIIDLRAASEMPGPLPPEFLARLSPTFLKAIGKPTLGDAEKKQGLSASAASDWLRAAGTQLVGIGLPTGFGSPTVAVFTGSFGNDSGRILVRMVFAEGWKVDWFSQGAVRVPALTPNSAEGSYQDFAVLAFLDALTGTTASHDHRALLVGALLSPKLKQSWAEPFSQDKDRSYDYSPAKLVQLATGHAGVTGFTRTPGEGDTFKIELAKGEAKTNYTLKLVKGATPGEWLVEEFTKQ